MIVHMTGKNIPGCKKSILIILAFICLTNSYSQKYNFRNFGTDNGLPQSFIYSISQDDDGYLWTGTGNGLSRYDGFHFDNYTINDSLQDNFITCSISYANRMWFGHMNGGITYYNGTKFQKVKTGFDPGRISHFSIDGKNNLWASSYSGSLICFSPDGNMKERFSLTGMVIINTFHFIDETNILVGTNTGMLICSLTRPDSLIIENKVGLPQSKIVSIVRDRLSHSFYVATENDGLFLLEISGNKVTAGEIGDFKISIQDLYMDSSSNLWICTFGAGLIKLNISDQKSETILPGDIKTVFEDREGSIWTGTYGKGLVQIYPKVFSLISYENQLSGNNIFSVCSDAKFRWLGTDKGLVKTDLNGNIVRIYGKSEGLPEDTVSALYAGQGNSVWIGTGRNGLYRLTDHIIKIKIPEGTLENSVTSITGTKDMIFAGTKKGLFVVSHVGNIIRYYSISDGGLPHNMINCVFAGTDNKIWITTRSNTICSLENGTIKKIALNLPGGVSTLGPIAGDSLSRIWVGSNGNGIFLLKSDSIVNLTSKEGLYSNYCYSVTFDKNGNAWIGHKGGLSRLKTNDFSTKPLQQIDDIKSGFLCNPNAGMMDPSGRVVIGTDKGIITYDPSAEPAGNVPPSLIIKSFRINDEERDFRNGIVLSPGNYKMKIDYLGISLKEPSQVTYQYRLAGYDQWSDITKNTSITFNHIIEGKYTFMLTASGADGTLTKVPMTISIIVRKPVWKNWWFIPALFITLVFVTVIYVKRREYKFDIEKKVLEAKVLERTQEINEQKNRIEHQRDLIDQKNANITSSIKYASHIQNSVLPSHALIDDLLPENFIIFKPKDIVSGDFYWISEKDKKIFVVVADCTGHGVPGAFMSLIGITFLNEIVNVQGITDSSTIVTTLRLKIIADLKQTEKEISSSDGMDLCLVVIDKDLKKVQFTGAMNNLAHIHEGNLNIIKADRTSVCLLYNNEGNFSSKEIRYTEGDLFYLFTDGYHDQFGGPDERKFLSAAFYKLLLEIKELPLSKQKENLETRLKDWMGSTEQTDDITVMGFRL
jgi:ligand-binding sensor domain-containing protein/serine phosphatase RsbU (regulator of sigma subunit)